MMHRTLALVTLFAYLFALPAAAQKADSFDCESFVRENHIGDTNRSGAQNMPGDPKRHFLLPDGTDVVQSREPTLIEKLSQTGGTIDSYDEINRADAHFACLLFLAQFKYKVDKDKFSHITLEYQYGNDMGNVDSIPALLPILFLSRFDSISERKHAYDDWSENPDFTISFKAIENFFTSWELELSSFETAAFLPGFDGDEAKKSQGLVVPIDNQPEFMQSWISEHDIQTNDLLVFCNPLPCEEFYEVFFTDVPVTDQADNSDTETDGVEPEQTSPSSPPFGVDLYFMREDDGSFENATSDLREKIGPLECLVFVIAPDLFIEEPVNSGCMREGQDELRKLKAAIRVTESGQWQLLKNGAVAPPVEVVVRLPAGQTTDFCLLSVEYYSESDKREVQQLEPLGDQFRLKFPEENPPAVVDGEVMLRLLPSGAEDCGGPERFVKVEADDVLEVDLTAAPEIFKAVTHLAVPMAGRRDSELGLDAAWDEDFGRSLVNAVGSAHVRLHRAAGDRPWALRAAELGQITPNAGVVRLLDLNAAELRTNPLQHFESPDAHEGAARIGRASTTFDTETAKRAIFEIWGKAKERGVDHLTVTIIAPILESGEAVAASPCSGNPIAAFAESTTFDLLGSELQIVAYPIIGLRDGDRINGEDLVPISGQSGADLGGLYRCMGTPRGIAIFPFYVESWRGPMDILPRYAAALSDQLYLTLAPLLD